VPILGNSEGIKRSSRSSRAPATGSRASAKKDTLRRYCASIASEALDSLTPEERHDFYKLVELEALIYPNCDLEIGWAGGEGSFVSNQGLVSTCQYKTS
jgi:hypothetical protein